MKASVKCPQCKCYSTNRLQLAALFRLFDSQGVERFLYSIPKDCSITCKHVWATSSFQPLNDLYLNPLLIAKKKASVRTSFDPVRASLWNVCQDRIAELQCCYAGPRTHICAPQGPLAHDLTTLVCIQWSITKPQLYPTVSILHCRAKKHARIRWGGRVFVLGCTLCVRMYNFTEEAKR